MSEKEMIHRVPQRCAFTMAELLAVIAIVGLLISLIATTIIQSKATAYRSSCANNLSQLGLSLRLYIEDNDGTWPEGDQWSQWSRSSHVSSCPLVDVPDLLREGHGVPGYAYNSALSQSQTVSETDVVLAARHDSDIVHPSTTVSVSESNEIFLLGPDICAYTAPCNDAGKEQGYSRHQGGSNYLFCDGHTRWYKPGIVRYAIPLTPITPEMENACAKGSATCNDGINDGVHPTFAVKSVGNASSSFP